MSLSSLIVQREVATIRQVEEALARQVLYGGDLVTNLLEVAQLDEHVLLPLLAESLGMPTGPIGELPPPTERARALVPADLASRRALMPLAVEDERLVLAVAEALASDVEQELSFALGMPIEQRVAPMVRIRQALAKAYGAPLERRMQRLIGRLGGVDATEPHSLPPLLKGAPVTRNTQPLGSVRAETEPRRGPITNAGFPPPSAPGVAKLAAEDSSPDVAARAEESPPEDATPIAPSVFEVEPRMTEPAPPIPSPKPAARRKQGQTPAESPAAKHGPSSRPRPKDPLSRAGEGRRATLLHLAQREGSPRQSPRRKRGPLTLQMAKGELEDAVDRDALLDLYFDFSRQFFEYSALFIVHGDIAEGRDAYGPGATREKVIGIGVPLDLPSALATARDRRAPVVTRPAPDGLDPVLLGDLQRTSASALIVIPVIVRARAVALLIGDGGDGGIDPASQGEVTVLASLVGQAFERLIVRKKLEGFGGTKGDAKVASVDPKRVSVKPRKRARPDLSAAADVLERALMLKQSSNPPKAKASDAPSEPGRAESNENAGERPGALRPGALASPLAESVRPPSHPLRPRQPNFAPLPPLEPEETSGGMSDLPPPPQVAAVRRPSGPPIPREEPPDDAPALELDLTPAGGVAAPHVETQELDEASESALLDELGEDAQADAAPDTSPDVAPYPAPAEGAHRRTEGAQAVAVPAHLPPTPNAAHKSNQALPTVIVDVSQEFAALVDRLIANGADEQAEAELLRQGQYAMPAIMSRFPGPITQPRDLIDDIPPRVGECGPILRLIAGQRRVALPFVLGEVASPDPERRFWATYLLTELAYPEAVPAIVARLFDVKERTRKVARIAAKAVADVARESLVEELDRIVRDPSATSGDRVATLDTLGEMRDALVVPVLINTLSEEDEEVALAAKRALLIVTRQDFGKDTKRWLSWWSANSSRHRIEWLIDALTHGVAAMRRGAGQELKAITKEYFGYYDDLPARERDRAQQRYREWWKSEGRARFRRT